MNEHNVIPFLRERMTPDGLFIEVGEPEPTVEAIRFGIETLACIGVAAIDHVHASSASFLAGCRRETGGFADRLHDPRPALAPTYYAVRLFALKRVAGRLPGRQKTIDWILEQLFGTDAGSPGLDIDELYYAVRALQLLEAPELDDRRIAVLEDYIERHHAPGGGYSRYPDDPPDIERTYCCLHMLQCFGRAPDPSGHIHWIRACMRDGNVYWDPTRQKVAPSTFYWGLRAASIAGVPVRWETATQGLAAFARGGGGYGNEANPGLWPTYCATHAIKLAKERGLQDVAAA